MSQGQIAIPQREVDEPIGLLVGGIGFGKPLGRFIQGRRRLICGRRRAPLDAVAGVHVGNIFLSVFDDGTPVASSN